MGQVVPQTAQRNGVAEGDVPVQPGGKLQVPAVGGVGKSPANVAEGVVRCVCGI